MDIYEYITIHTALRNIFNILKVLSRYCVSYYVNVPVFVKSSAGGYDGGIPSGTRDEYMVIDENGLRSEQLVARDWLDMMAGQNGPGSEQLVEGLAFKY